MPELELDHIVIYIDDWEACHAFYVEVLGLDLVENPQGQANPLGAWAYRLGSHQINVHGPWPGRPSPCCPSPLNEVGRADLAFHSPRPTTDNVELLRSQGIEVTDGPVRRFGARGWGTSVYCSDPSRNGVELISYEDS